MCDTFVVVHEGGVLFGKNSDRDPNEAQILDWVPAATHARGATLACTWSALPQVERTHAVLLSRPYWMWGAEMGANEHGVVIGNEAVFTRRGHEGTGLLGMDLVRLALERGATASEAADVICALVERHGQGGRAGYDDASFRYHNSFLVADADEAIVVETAGREHACERVAAGVRAISNGLTIAGFAQRHADRIRGRVARCEERRSRVETLGAQARSPADVAHVLRDHGPGRVDPHYSPLTGAMGAPCMHAGGMVASSQTVGSWISELRPERSRHFATGTAAPCLSAFKPVALAAPLALGSPTGVQDTESAWWRFERVHRVLIGDSERAAAWRRRRDAFERWDGDWAPAEAWRAWAALVDEGAEQLLDDRRDSRPRWVRHYWDARAADATAAAPKLPPRRS